MKMSMFSIFEILGRVFFPRSQIKDFARNVSASGIEMPVESFMGYLATAIILFTIFLTLVFLSFPDLYAVFTGFFKTIGLANTSQFLIVFSMLLSFLILSYASIFLMVNAFLVLQADTRRNVLENSLPDFLLLVSANIKAGMGLDQAMWYSAKPEFGLLSIEVKNIIKSAFSGEPLDKALDRLAERFNSRLFTRTIALVKQAFATGGEIAQVLEETASDARNTATMKKEVSASLVLYEIFILFASIAGTPFLFSVSGKLIQVFEAQRAALPTAASFSTLGGITISSPGNVISSTEFYYFSLATILVTSLLSSFIISVIRTGTKNEGVKYFPFIAFLSYLVYFLVTFALANFFTTLA